MKITIWDVLAVMGLIVLCLVAALILWLFINPYTSINPFPPPTLPATLDIPTNTATLQRLPATWTVAPEFRSPTPELETQTPVPTNTSFILPTYTPSLTPSLTPSITNTPTPDDAELVNRLPTYGEVFGKGASFDLVLEVRNTGTTTWSTAYRFRYVSGVQFQEGGTSYNLANGVSPGSNYKIILDAIAPSDTGVHSSTWELVNNNNDRFYLVTFTIKVE